MADADDRFSPFSSLTVHHLTDREKTDKISGAYLPSTWPPVARIESPSGPGIIMDWCQVSWQNFAEMSSFLPRQHCHVMSRGTLPEWNEGRESTCHTLWRRQGLFPLGGRSLIMEHSSVPTQPAPHPHPINIKPEEICRSYSYEEYLTMRGRQKTD